MIATDTAPFDRGDVACSYHPSITTRLRCSRCGKPICPRCGVRTPVGLRCPDCAGVRGLPTYRTNSTTLVKAAGVGMVVAGVVGILWGFIPEWGFYLALLLGFGSAEAIAKVSNQKRGLDLQVLAIGIVVLGVVISRAILAQRYGVGLDELNRMDPATNVLRLALFPDLIYIGFALAIGWVRFR
jgi:hypothetical protein